VRPVSSPATEPSPDDGYARLATQLVASGDPTGLALKRGTLPDRDDVLGTIDRLHRVLLAETLPPPASGGGPAERVASELAEIESHLAGQVRRALSFPARIGGERHADEKTLDAEGRRIARALIERLPWLRERVFEDARAAWRGDPSCHHPIEALYAFPGVFAITRHRIAHILYELDVPLLPRLVAEDAHQRTGIDIHPGAQIGHEFFIDHGTGVVIGETAIVGNRVTLYQGVTLGAKSFPVDEYGRLVKGLARHPIVEDDVTIYASATVLGRVTVGHGSVIGGNVWLTHDVPPNSRVSQAAPLQTGFEHGAGI
jgi:serine O-acetyltransferase